MLQAPRESFVFEDVPERPVPSLLRGFSAPVRLEYDYSRSDLRALMSRDDEATVRLDLPRHVVASRLSITPETLSRLLRAMSDDGILTVDDRLVFVHSLARLRPYD